ncbi:hypothetical protein GCM10027053_11510 [Intrasporangium mesophilum]
MSWARVAMLKVVVNNLLVTTAAADRKGMDTGPSLSWGTKAQDGDSYNLDLHDRTDHQTEPLDAHCRARPRLLAQPTREHRADDPGRPVA